MNHVSGVVQQLTIKYTIILYTRVQTDADDNQDKEPLRLLTLYSSVCINGTHYSPCQMIKSKHETTKVVVGI